jgi:hypothetical protein
MDGFVTCVSYPSTLLFHNTKKPFDNGSKWHLKTSKRKINIYSNYSLIVQYWLNLHVLVTKYQNWNQIIVQRKAQQDASYNLNMYPSHVNLMMIKVCKLCILHGTHDMIKFEK